MTLFAVERSPGLTVSRDIDKLGYKGIETCEVVFEDVRVPVANVIGGQEGRGLQMVLTEQIRSQDASLQLSRFLGNPAARGRTWAFIKSNWTALAPKVTIFGGDTRLVAGLGSFCDAKARDDIKTFFAAHPLPGAARTLDQTIERIDNCLTIRTAQAENVAGWLASR